MLLSGIQDYLCSTFLLVPYAHWVIIGMVTLLSIVISRIRKKFPFLGSIALGITVLIGALLFETTVVIRYLGYIRHGSGYNFFTEFIRLFNGDERYRIQVFSNFVVYIPFGFFMTAYVSSIDQFRFWQQVGYVSFLSFVFSLSIECLQLILRVGYFELLDLITNTVGAFIGAFVFAFVRKVFRSRNP